MSQRFRAAVNVNESKTTRLPVAEDFAAYRFGRDELAHVSRYLFVAEFIESLAEQEKRPLRILDVGCGDIYIARVLNSSIRTRKTTMVAEYVGFDIDDVLLQRAQTTLPQSMPIRLVLGDVTMGALVPLGRFDLVVCLEVLEHLQPQFVGLALKQLAEAGDHVVISTPNGTGGTGKIPEDHVKEWDCEELTGLMQQVGLKVLRRIGVFCNLARVKQIAKSDERIASFYAFFEPRMDSALLSLCMARLIGVEAQNVMYVCRGKPRLLDGC